MFRFVIAILVCLLALPIFASAQQIITPYQYRPYQVLPFGGYPPHKLTPQGDDSRTPFAMDLHPILMRETINFRDDQWSTAFQRTRVEMGVSVTVPELVRARVSVLPGIETADSTIPLGGLQVGLTEFGSTTQGQQQQQTQGQSGDKQVNITWKEDLSVRLGVAGLVNFPLKPVVVLEWPSFTITAIGQKDGKQITDSETFKKLVGGVGGLLEYQNGDMRVEVVIAASNNYTLVQGLIHTRITPGLNFDAGGFWKQINLEGLKKQDFGPYAGLNVAL